MGPTLPIWCSKPPEPDDPPPSPWEAGREAERVVNYRRERLEELGLPYPMALQLALGREDWHAIARAVERGMTPEQVERVFL